MSEILPVLRTLPGFTGKVSLLATYATKKLRKSLERVDSGWIVSMTLSCLVGCSWCWQAGEIGTKGVSERLRTACRSTEPR